MPQLWLLTLNQSSRSVRITDTVCYKAGSTSKAETRLILSEFHSVDESFFLIFVLPLYSKSALLISEQRAALLSYDTYIFENCPPEPKQLTVHLAFI